jgi:kynurenine formamidase
MKIFSANTLILLILLSLNTFCAKQETNWDKWGADDQIGTLNYITPGVIKTAATLVRTGRTYTLAIPLAEGQPSADRKLEHHMLDTGQGARDNSSPGPRNPLWLQDWLSLPIHGTTHWDGLGHVFGEGKIYNGFDAEQSITYKGALRNGMEHTKDKIVSRGVLLDLVLYKGKNPLPSGMVITPEDLEGAARKQAVEFHTGDILLIRTGWINVWRQQPDGREKFKGSQPGIGWAVSQWLKDRQIAAIAVDNLEAEVIPCEPEAAQRIGHPDFERPIHYELIRNQGMMIGELFSFETLARACAEDGHYDFMFVAAPLHLPLATGSPTNPQAIK